MSALTNLARLTVKALPALLSEATNKELPLKERAVAGGILAGSVAIVVTLAVLGYINIDSLM